MSHHIPTGAGAGCNVGRSSLWLWRAFCAVGIALPVLTLICLAVWTATSFGAATGIPADVRRDAVCAALNKPDNCALSVLLHHHGRAIAYVDDATGQSWLTLRVRGVTLAASPVPALGALTEAYLWDEWRLRDVLRYYTGDAGLQAQFRSLGFPSGVGYVDYRRVRRVLSDGRTSAEASEVEVSVDVWVVS